MYQLSGYRREGYTPPVTWWKPWTWFRVGRYTGEWEDYKKTIYTEEYIKKQIADLCHEQWAGWMRYLFTKGKINTNGTFIIQAKSVQRWHRQMRTSYGELSESEQLSDQKEAQKFIDLLISLGFEINKDVEVEFETPKPEIKVTF